MKYPMIAFNKIHPTTVGADLSARAGCPDVRISYSICIIAPLGVAWPTPDAEHPVLESFIVRSYYLCLSTHALV